MSKELTPDAFPGLNAQSTEDLYIATFSGTDAIFTGELDDGLYDATLVNVTKITGDNPFKPGEQRTQLRWDFTIDGREEDGCLKWYTSFSMNEKSKLPGTLTALGRPLPTPSNPGIGKKEDLVGLQCSILIENVPGKKDPNRRFPRITKVLRKTKGGKR